MPGCAAARRPPARRDPAEQRHAGAAGLDRASAAAAYSAADIGTATPVSNDATVFSYPREDGPTSFSRRNAAGSLPRPAAPPRQPWSKCRPRLASASTSGATVSRQVGLLREDLFAQGYGEENDLCIRARHLGWRHVAVPGVFVAHAGAGSFGSAKAQLLARNLSILNRLHPGYDALIARFPAGRPAGRSALPDGRAALAPAPLAQGRGGADHPCARRRGETADRGAAPNARAAGAAPSCCARPDRQRAGPQGGSAYRPGLVRLEDGDAGAYPNLVFALPREIGAVVGLLRPDRPAAMEVHHLLGHDHAVLRLAAALGIPEDIHLHDYAWFCPRITLLGPERRYCGEPEIRACAMPASPMPAAR